MANKAATADASAASAATEPPLEVSSKPTGSSEEDVKAEAPPKPKTPAKFAFHAIKIFDGLAVMSALFIILIARFFRPGFWSTLLYTLAGLPAGLAMSFLYFKRKREKRSRRQLYNIEPGAKGVTELLQKIPTWLTLSEVEKCEWLNAVLLELWPFYDYAVCELEICEPIFESVKPPGFKKISFRKLQFGDAPIRIETVKMNRSRKEGVFLEMDFRWAGDPDIQLAIDTLGAGEASQICPKISKVRVVGTLGIHLRPLVDEIPGFGAIIVTLLKPPKIRYQVNLGAALGGSVTAAPIVAFVDGLLPSILNGFLVWPERIVVPMFDEKVIGPIEDYMLRHQGVLKVEVLEAREIPKMDTMGSSDPFVKIFTDPKRVVKTATKSNTLNPVWENEVFYLMVQEPETQYLRFEMFDVDFVSVKSFTKLKLTKAVTDTFNAEESMGKGEVNLNDVCVNHPGEVVDRWFALGPEDWSADDGPGKGCGELKLRLTYAPLQRINPMVGRRGNFFVNPKAGKDFPMMVPKNPKSTSAYYVAKVGKESQKGPVKFGTIEPDWTGTGVAFYGVSNSELLKITFYNSSSLGLDQDLGEVSVEIAAVRKAVHREQKGRMRKVFDLQDADCGSIELEFLFVPEF